MTASKDMRGYELFVGSKVARAVNVGRNARLVIEEVTKIREGGKVCLEGRVQPVRFTDRLIIVEGF